MRYRAGPWRRSLVLDEANDDVLRRPYWEYSLSVGKGPDDHVFVGLRFTYILGLR